MIEPIKKEQSQLHNDKISLDSITKDIKSYLHMRNISVPLFIYNNNTNISIIFRFDNTEIDFTTTNLITSYTDSINYIEEMNDDYTTSPFRHYTHK